VRINGDLRYALPGVLNASFRYIKGDALATALAFENIAVSTGSACHAHEVKPSHVLVALGLDAEWLFSAIRFSLGHDTTTAEIEEVLAVVTRVIGRLRAASPLARKAQLARAAEALPDAQARIRPSAHPTTAGPFAFVVASSAPEDSQEMAALGAPRSALGEDGGQPLGVRAAAVPQSAERRAPSAALPPSPPAPCSSASRSSPRPAGGCSIRSASPRGRIWRAFLTCCPPSFSSSS
jgi:Aminotransferase class-V